MTTTTRCTAEGAWSHTGVDEDGTRRYANAPGDTAICKNCGADLFADEFWSGTATLVPLDMTGRPMQEDYRANLVDYRQSAQWRDPLAELAQFIGANLPFAVDHFASTGEMVGKFSGGRTVAVRVYVSRSVEWTSDNANAE